jgi:hypothetical protein
VLLSALGVPTHSQSQTPLSIILAFKLLFPSPIRLKLDAYAHFNGPDSYYQLTNGSRVYLITSKEIHSGKKYLNLKFGNYVMRSTMHAPSHNLVSFGLSSDGIVAQDNRY